MGVGLGALQAAICQRGAESDPVMMEDAARAR